MKKWKVVLFVLSAVAVGLVLANASRDHDKKTSPAHVGKASSNSPQHASALQPDSVSELEAIRLEAGAAR